ncbi:MAG: sigma-70 family RNA polymerase sigma factor [Planctomycetota bacterium]
MSEAKRSEFEALVAPHLDALFGYCMRLARNQPDAEDLLQEGLYKAFRGLAGFERGTHFRAWVFRILTNAWISRVRKEQRRPTAVDLDAVPDVESAVHQEVYDAETNWGAVYHEVVDDEVKQALDELPDEFRLPLLLSSLGGLRYKEVAQALDLPLGTVMSRLFRARQKLRRSLRDYAAERGIPVTEATS